MTEIHSVLVGAYPRSEELIKAFRSHLRRRLSEKELRKLVVKEEEEVVSLQKEVGLRYVIDGMLDWHDLLRPLAENLEGIELNGLARWFDNNTFYRKPVIVGEVRREGNLLENFFHPELIKEAEAKLILPDPYSFTLLSVIKRRRFDEVVFEVAEAFREELLEIEASTRIGQVQLSAPTLVWRKLSPDELEIAGEAVEEVFKGVEAEKMLHLFFGDALKAFPQVLDYDVDVLGFDLTATSVRKLSEYSIDKNVALGVVDGRNSLLEKVETAVGWVKLYLEHNEPSILYVTPSCDLEFLPRNVAEKKVRVLGEIMYRLREEM